MFSYFCYNFTMQVLPCDIHHRTNHLVCSMMIIFAGFTSYVVSVTRTLSVTYITGHNWISLLSKYNLKPYDELQFGLTNMPKLVLLTITTVSHIGTTFSNGSSIGSFSDGTCSSTDSGNILV